MTTREHYSGYEPGCHEHHEHHGHHEHCEHRHHHSRGGGLLEAAIMAPLAITGCVLQTVKHCLTSACCGTWCNSCDTCGCNCDCKDKGGEHKERHHHDCSTADLKIDTRLGEVREKMILVENNSPHTATITLEADPWLNIAGAQAGASIVFDPPTVTLEHCKTALVKATINVNQPLEAGKSYFSRIHLRGCSCCPITVELCVASENRVDYYAACDSCRPRCGHFVEFCHECEEGHGKCGHHRWDPFQWLGIFDPHCHWFDEYRCERFMLPNLLGTRCC